MTINVNGKMIEVIGDILVLPNRQTLEFNVSEKVFIDNFINMPYTKNGNFYKVTMPISEMIISENK